MIASMALETTTNLRDTIRRQASQSFMLKIFLGKNGPELRFTSREINFFLCTGKKMVLSVGNIFEITGSTYPLPLLWPEGVWLMLENAWMSRTKGTEGCVDPEQHLQIWRAQRNSPCRELAPDTQYILHIKSSLAPIILFRICYPEDQARHVVLIKD